MYSIHACCITVITLLNYVFYGCVLKSLKNNTAIYRLQSKCKEGEEAKAKTKKLKKTKLIQINKQQNITMCDKSELGMKTKSGWKMIGEPLSLTMVSPCSYPLVKATLFIHSTNLC